jgi:hypothetical protein
VLRRAVQLGWPTSSDSSRTRRGTAARAFASVAACLPLLASSAPALAQEGGEQDAPAPAVSATVGECIAAATAADRSVTFTGQMETVTGAHRMAMQIVVQERTRGEAGFHTLSADGLGAWQRSEAGVKIYKYVRQVTDLPAPAAFRAVVEYHWLNEKGRVIRTDERRTSVCREPAPHPKSPTTPTPTATPGSPTTPSAGTAPDTTPATGTTSAATMLRA